jgi:hypothetical protein
MILKKKKKKKKNKRRRRRRRRRRQFSDVVNDAYYVDCFPCHHSMCVLRFWKVKKGMKLLKVVASALN